MTLRPVSARWFELLTVRPELARTLECLSRTGAVELEAKGAALDKLALSDLDMPLGAHRELAKRYRTYWPVPKSAGRRDPEQLIATLTAARARIAAWQEAADPIIAAIERASSEHDNLASLRAALEQAGAEFPDLKLLGAAGPRFGARLFQLPARTRLRDLPALALFKTWATDSAAYALFVGRQADIHRLELELPALKGRMIPLPAWLPSSLAAALPAVADRLAGLAAERTRLADEIAALNERMQVAAALGDIALVDWLNRHASDLRGGRRLAWITGWTSDIDGRGVRRSLDAARIRYLLRLSDAPSGAIAPSVLINPAWLRGFEIFTRMLGMPGRDESDPTFVLGLMVPLIFGFMFGDLGQGLVISSAALVLRRRVPLLQILVPGGFCAMAFGAAFGSVFCREDLIPALWVRPLHDPLVILTASLAIGAVVLLIGLALEGLQAHWRGEARQWWSERAGLLPAYVAALAAPIHGEALAGVALGATWYLLGAMARSGERPFASLARAAAEFVEEFFRLLINTVSFTRLGAFALAHAGLSAATLEIADASGPIAYWPVLAAGNALIIVLEGTVVSIQTTRLVLFEFFIRFLSARGRAFKPLPPPDLVDNGWAKPEPGGLQ
jgi:V/A-type H+-transporting ATPase subunit I